MTTLSRAEIGVIIPAYNAEKYLPGLINSIHSQTMQDFLVIAVDDCSTDSTSDILQNWASRDSRVVYLRQKENSGLSSTRNVGLDYIRTHDLELNFICFIDDDDRYQDYALETMLENMQEHNLDILFFSAEPEFESLELASEFSQYKTYYTRKGVYDGIYRGPEIVLLMQGSDDFRPSACLQCFSKSFLMENDIRFLNGILHEDNLFTFNCLLLAQRVACIENKLYIRRIRHDSLMTKPISWKNVEGYFYCGAESLYLLQNIVSKEDHRVFASQTECNSITGLVQSFFSSALSYYSHLSDAERQIIDEAFRNHANCADNTLFASVVAGPYRQSIEEYQIGVERLRADFENSWSYKLGRMLTAIPRKLLSRR